MKTLSEFIVERQAEYPNAKGELSGILSSIRLLAKIIHRDINKAGLTNYSWSVWCRKRAG